ncbi:Protein FD [Vitis vinifera]|uniref:Protein FD n=2 Tax=Vitis vinifera TaxID=29760 RepID=A0A438J2R5_VITVI|nr:Protein FD [Vitis vinifera]
MHSTKPEGTQTFLSIPVFLFSSLICSFTLPSLSLSLSMFTMWSSLVDDDDNGSSKRVSCSPSTSSTCSSHPPFSPSSPIPDSSPKKTMDEVWKDLSLSSLHHHSISTVNNATTNTHHAFRSTLLQDFLARPSNMDPLRTGTSTADPSSAGAATPFASPLPPPPTLLSLNSLPDFHCIDDTDPMKPHSHLHNNATAATPYLYPPFNVLAAASPEYPSFRKKRPRGSDDNSGDRRHKRLIKNRESAARSRARKQAYTNELELEVAHLIEENARLKRLQQKFCPEASAQLPKKHTLYRTSTAPF